MADIDIDPFGDHDKTDEGTSEDEMIPLNLAGESKKGLAGSQNEKRCSVGRPYTPGS